MHCEKLKKRNIIAKVWSLFILIPPVHVSSKVKFHHPSSYVDL